jgi:alkaline phosphatase
MTLRRDLLKHIGLGAVSSLIAGKAAAQSTKASSPKKLRGIIFLVSDGMSPGVLTLAQAFSKQVRNADTTWWKLLQRPDVVNGLMDTASANSLVTDSAAASSSWGSGHRVNNGMINVTPSGRFLEPIAWTLAERGIRTGLVSTASITHATPAGFASQVKTRDDEPSIARQYLDRVDILLGGGLEFFQASTRKDQQDLPAAYQAAGYQVAFDAKTLASTNSQKILGLFAPRHLPFSLDRNHDDKLKETVPTLAAMATKALQTFLQSDKRFLLQVEGARIDHAAHLNDAAALLHDQLAYDDAAAAILAMLQDRDDVLVILTSDHGNSNP